MPIYEYECQKCGHFEVTQRITENPLSRCPTCKEKVKKLISNTSFQLKGTGWYLTDYARKDRVSGDGNKSKTPSAEAKSDGKAGSNGGEKTSTEKSTTKGTGSESKQV
jgi:putative FmdB family regulatory protein